MPYARVYVSGISRVAQVRDESEMTFFNFFRHLAIEYVCDVFLVCHIAFLVRCIRIHNDSHSTISSPRRFTLHIIIIHTLDKIAHTFPNYDRTEMNLNMTTNGKRNANASERAKMKN